MLIVTDPVIAGKSVEQTLGAVFGVAVRSRSEMGNFLGKIRAIAGGKMGGYEKLVMSANQGAVAAMIAQAEQAGANAVVSFRFSASSMGGGEEEEFIEVTAYGTAVVLR
ncbi:heavy metal-binding domain-containing protein [Acidithiobacillus sp. HP-6]|uniref:YbjQ family protein n=1 Tax=unclassified Acidithiobacillus TaxID=2614800 RepID=UPI00187ACE92|nr:MULTISPECIES: heavy metal-binding domain-containing protein [unclassified Acidithiobacillus]MBE7562688.1 heavy metal-binding domain-containing protein [Acidithiobacillus sp. HP-6]MBE7570516.1 heavy metal-binding domain-containing protein [Acidithiobacillus sp. HP-2]